MTQEPLKARMTLDEYMAFEEHAKVRHEFVNGLVIAMNGGTVNHHRLCSNLSYLLGTHTRKSQCVTFSNGMKVFVQAANSVYYPDLFVACGDYKGTDVLIGDPTLIIEVLSKSTAAIDRREKLSAYMQIPSLQEYLIIDQTRRKVDVFGRAADGEWMKQSYLGNASVTVLSQSAVGALTLSLDDIYERVDLPKRDLEVRESSEEDYLDSEWYPEALVFQ